MTSALTSITKTNSDMTFDNFLSYVSAIPDTIQESRNYFAMAVVINESIEPIVSTKAPVIDLLGKNLSADVTNSKGFQSQLNEILPSILDPSLLALLKNCPVPLTETMVLSKSVETVDEVAKVVIFIGRMDKDKTKLAPFCDRMVKHLLMMKGSSSFHARLLFADFVPSFFSLTYPSLQETLIEASMPTSPVLKPSEMDVFEKRYHYGISEKTNIVLTVERKEGQIITTQKKEVVKTNFRDSDFERKSLNSLELTT